MPILKARQGAAVHIHAGQYFKLINTHGKQVVDFWAFHPTDVHNYLSTVHCRTISLSVALRPNTRLYSNKRKHILTLVEDTTPGIHDMIWSACDKERYRMQGYVGVEEHDNCHDIMHGVLHEAFPDIKISDDWIPDPVNLFMNIPINHNGGIAICRPTSEKGQYVVFRAETELVLVMSACPQDMDLAVNAGQPTDCEYGVFSDAACQHAVSPGSDPSTSIVPSAVPRSLTLDKPMLVKVALSFDFDALSHWLGTGCHADNNMADYSSGIFAGQTGCLRLLHVLEKNKIADKVTWFVPGHTIETFPSGVQKVVASGAEIGLHGYAHEGIHQMTPEQERDVLVKCIDVATKLVGKKPRGYRAPMYTIRETTVELLREHGFLYDTSLMHHDSQPYWTPADPPVEKIDFHKEASSWLHPTPIMDPSSASANPLKTSRHPLVEIPCGWYNEDMMPLQYLPHLANSMGYVSVSVVEQMWKDKFTWLWENARAVGEADPAGDCDFVFPILMHPDTSGMAHIIGMADRMIQWLKSWGPGVEFCRHEDIASGWLEVQKKKVSE